MGMSGSVNVENNNTLSTNTTLFINNHALTNITLIVMKSGLCIQQFQRKAKKKMLNMPINTCIIYSITV